MDFYLFYLTTICLQERGVLFFFHFSFVLFTAFFLGACTALLSLCLSVFFLCACMAAWHRYGFYLFAGGFFFSFSDQWADPIDCQTTDPRREVCILGKCIKSIMAG